MKPAAERPSDRAHELGKLAGLFLKLGTIAFGGPAAHIALMEDEVVRRLRWLTHEEFLDMLGATNLIPGPNSTEMAIHIGLKRAGWAGLVVAGTCFILPAILIVGICAWAYVRFGALPQVQAILYGVKPAIIAIVIQALWRLGRTAVKTPLVACVGAITVTMSFMGVNELLVLFGAGFGLLVIRWLRRARPIGMLSLALTTSSAGSGLAGSATTAAIPFGMWPMFLFFLKVGSVLFGSGYVLLAFLRADLVERWHWLTESQLLDAIAVGQVTPGPVFTTATFIGYVLGGSAGAVMATIGIFLPAFIFVALSAPLLSRLRTSPLAGAFLDGVNVASLGLMVMVTWHLGRVAIIDIPTLLLALASAIVLLSFRLNSVWLVFAGAMMGLVRKFV